MNKLYITIVALAALASVAYANSNRSYDVRDLDTCMGTHCNNATELPASNALTVISPLVVGEKDTGLSNFERTMKISKENDQGRH